MVISRSTATPLFRLGLRVGMDRTTRMADHGYHAQVKRLGIPDRWIEHGTQAELYAECGFDDKALIAAAKEMLDRGSDGVRVSA